VKDEKKLSHYSVEQEVLDFVVERMDVDACSLYIFQ